MFSQHENIVQSTKFSARNTHDGAAYELTSDHKEFLATMRLSLVTAADVPSSVGTALWRIELTVVVFFPILPRTPRTTTMATKSLKAIAPVPTAADFLDIVLSKTQRKTPTVCLFRDASILLRTQLAPPMHRSYIKTSKSAVFVTSTCERLNLPKKPLTRNSMPFFKIFRSSMQVKICIPGLYNLYLTERWP